MSFLNADDIQVEVPDEKKITFYNAKTNPPPVNRIVYMISFDQIDGGAGYFNGSEKGWSYVNSMLCSRPVLWAELEDIYGFNPYHQNKEEK